MRVVIKLVDLMCIVFMLIIFELSIYDIDGGIRVAVPPDITFYPLHRFTHESTEELKGACKTFLYLVIVLFLRRSKHGLIHFKWKGKVDGGGGAY